MPVEMNAKIYTLSWSLASSESEIPNRSIIYQIYGDSPIYGRDKLLYIGQTDGDIARPFSHMDNKRINNFSVRYALCPKSELDFLEAILIATHKPSYNEKCIADSTFIRTNDLRIVFNEDDRGDLLLETSNMYWL
ncbi:MAG: GIY-YIG nuclease family protein [Eubacteriales bacterium]|jgi:hypothetical protein